MHELRSPNAHSMPHPCCHQVRVFPNGTEALITESKPAPAKDRVIRAPVRMAGNQWALELYRVGAKGKLHFPLGAQIHSDLLEC